MPIYEFKCEFCSNIDEHLMKISDPNPEKCSKCGGKVNKIMSRSSFSLKGSGWYATDYKSDTPQVNSTKSESNNLNTNTKTETNSPQKPDSNQG
jgi:putative FmdB family regulatory protein